MFNYDPLVHNKGLKIYNKENFGDVLNQVLFACEKICKVYRKVYSKI